MSGVFSQIASITPPAIDKPSVEDLWNLLKVGHGVRGSGQNRNIRFAALGPDGGCGFCAVNFLRRNWCVQ